MKTLKTSEVKEKRDQGVPLVNVLDEDQFSEGHIPGSKNAPVGADDFADQVEDIVGSKDAPIIVYCASTDCDASPKAARKLEDAGFSEVYDYEAGTMGWKAAGEPVETSN